MEREKNTWVQTAIMRELRCGNCGRGELYNAVARRTEASRVAIKQALVELEERGLIEHSGRPSVYEVTKKGREFIRTCEVKSMVMDAICAGCHTRDEIANHVGAGCKEQYDEVCSALNILEDWGHIELRGSFYQLNAKAVLDGLVAFNLAEDA